MFKIARADTPSSLEQAEQILEQIRREEPKHWPHGLTVGHFDGGLYLVMDKQASVPVGFVGWQERREGLTKVGYYAIGILPEHRRNGYARDAVQTLIAKKASRVDRVRAMIVDGNLPSVRLADGLGVPKKMVKRAELDDKGGWAAVGGSALLGDTAHSLHRAGKLGDRLLQFHDGIASRPTDLIDPDKALQAMGRYGELAGEASRLRVLGAPVGRLFQFMPPSALVDNPREKGVGLGNWLRWRTGGKVAPDVHQRLTDAAGHYRGFVEDPQRVQIMEMATGRASGRVKQLNRLARAAGLDRNTLSAVLYGDSPTPLLQLHEQLMRDPARHKAVQRLYYSHVRNLLAGGTPMRALNQLTPEKAMDFGPGAYGRLAKGLSKGTLPIGAAALGLGGYGAWRLNKQASAMTPDQEQAAGLAGLGGGGYFLNRARKYSPSNLIVATGGHLGPPVSAVDTGLGHVTPARAIHEALLAHPAVQSGEFRADLALREMDKEQVKRWLAERADTGGGSSHPGVGMFKSYFKKDLQKPLQLVSRQSLFGNHGNRNALMTVDSGFGATFDVPLGYLRKPEFDINPAGRVGFVPDYLAHDELDAGKRFIFGGGPSWRPNRLFTFGPRKLRDNQFLLDNIEHFQEHPALSDSVLNLAREHLDGKGPARAEVLQDLVGKLSASGDQASAGLLQQALQSGKKLVTVSGSGRGDLVAWRAANLQRLLEQKGLADKIQVVAMMANAKGNALDPTGELLKGLPVVQVGNTANLYGAGKGPSSMFNILNSSDYHWGSTGASSQGEAGLLSTPTAFVTQYVDQRDKMLDRLKALKVLDGEQEGLIRNVNLDQWNAGAIQNVLRTQHGRGMGLDSANTAEEFLPLLEKALASPARFTERARRQLNLHVRAKKDFADALIEEARKLRKVTGGMRDRRLMLGAGLLGAGVLGLGHAQQRKEQPLERVKARLRDLKNRIIE